ncbi:MAG: hypothetical protein GY830_03785 [Bacteroidetes bacterium]|nr:hypothetical protein [Bacteroidota bacterium]
MKKISNLLYIMFITIFTLASCGVNNSINGMQSTDDNLNNSAIDNQKQNEKEKPENNDIQTIEVENDQNTNNSKIHKNDINDSNTNLDYNRNLNSSFVKAEKKTTEETVELGAQTINTTNIKINNIKEPQYQKPVSPHVLNALNNDVEEIDTDAEEEINEATYVHAKRKKNDVKQQFINKEDNNESEQNSCKSFCNYLFCYLCLCKCFYKYCQKGKVEFPDDKFHKIDQKKKGKLSNDENHTVR